MGDEDPGIFRMIPEGAGNLDTGMQMSPGGMQNKFKWVVSILPYPAQNLFCIFFIYELVNRHPKKREGFPSVNHGKDFAAVVSFHYFEF